MDGNNSIEDLFFCKDTSSGLRAQHLFETLKRSISKVVRNGLSAFVAMCLYWWSSLHARLLKKITLPLLCCTIDPLHYSHRWKSLRRSLH